MIAPSPDWFSGFNAYNVLDELSETWYSSFIIETYPWDAATDNGTTYESPDSPTAWDRPFQLTTERIPDSGIFLSPDGTAVNNVAIWSCWVSATTPAPTTSPAPTVSFRPSPAPTNTMEPTLQFGFVPTDIESTEPSAKPSTEAYTAAWSGQSTTNTTGPTVQFSMFPTVTESVKPSANTSTEADTSALDTLNMSSTALPLSYSTEPGNIPAFEDVIVTCVFGNDWWEATHPNDYPDDAHWSPMVLASQSNGYEMWRPGVLASQGVQQVAETGNFSILESELNAADTTVLDHTFGYTMHNFDSQTQVFNALQLDFVHSHISTISMLGPSPAWFSGFSSFRVIDPETEMWYSSFTIDTYPFDAGTNSGATYDSEYTASDPRLFIYPLTAETVPESGVFLVPNGTTVLPVATWTCAVQPAQETDVSGATVMYLRTSGAFAHSLTYSWTMFAMAWTML